MTRFNKPFCIASRFKDMPNKLSDDKQRISASLPKKLIEAIKRKAEKEGRTFTDVLAEALIELLNEDKEHEK